MNSVRNLPERELISLPPGSSEIEALKVLLHNCRVLQDAEIASAKKSGDEEQMRRVSKLGMRQLARSIRKYELQLDELKRAQSTSSCDQ